MPRVWVFSVLGGVLFQFQPRCLAGVWAVELRAWFSLRDYQKWRSACLWPLAASSRRLSKESGRAGVQGAEVQMEGGIRELFFWFLFVCLFCCSFVFAKHATSSFPFGPLGPEDSELSNTDQQGLSLLSVLPISSLATEKPGIWKSGTLALLPKLSWQERPVPVDLGKEGVMVVVLEVCLHSTDLSSSVVLHHS